MHDVERGTFLTLKLASISLYAFVFPLKAVQTRLNIKHKAVKVRFRSFIDMIFSVGKWELKHSRIVKRNNEILKTDMTVVK